jgi:hypothetical protein
MAGCVLGNCLRSHVDFDETFNALSMVTKAGVPAEKVIVGIASYGRQFKMVDPSCTNENCTYVGPKSTATPGRCTDTPEYISYAEIKEIAEQNPNARIIKNSGFSKTLTYDGNWVSYMDDQDQQQRANFYKALNFGGTTDWAIDLKNFMLDDTTIRNGGWRGEMMRDSHSPFLLDGKLRCQKDHSWRDVKCDNPGMQDVKNDPQWRWNMLKTDAAWCDAVSDWIDNSRGQPGIDSFPDMISNYLHGEPNFYCDKLDIVNLCHTGRCTQDGTGAATQFILESLQNIHAVNIYLTSSVPLICLRYANAIWSSLS